jgi:transposase
MPDGIQGRDIPLIPRTRWPDAEPCRVQLLKWQQDVSDSIVGIDVSKETLDANCARDQRKQARGIFDNGPDGWKRVLSWLKAMGSKQAHICMEATGRHSLGVALALYDAGHVVSVVNPAQIRDFARTKLGRNKTDKVDAALIREYAELFKPQPWMPPSPAMRRLCELQTVRAGLVANRAEWKNRLGSGLGEGTAIKVATATIDYFTSQLETIDRAIGETIDQDCELRSRRDLLLSVIGVGETLAALLLTEMPEPGVLCRSGEMVAYAGLNPSHRRSGTSIDRPTRFPRSAMLLCVHRYTCRRCPPCDSTPRSRLSWLASKAQVASSPSRSLWRQCASSWCSALVC